jgi:hypothetical protein
MKKRPSSVTILSWLVLCFSVWNFIRFGAAIFFWQTLEAYHSLVHPAYVAGTGLIWGLAGLPLAWGLRQGKAWAGWVTLGAAAGYGSWYWIDRLALQNPPPNGSFALAITVILLLLCLVIIIWPKNRRWFKENSRHSGEIDEQS